MEYNTNFEIEEVENFSGSKDLNFSHNMLVMKAMQKCIDAGCHEMKEGYQNEKIDKLGNRTLFYLEDTRKKFISSVQSAIMVMICDFDEKAHKNIEKIQSYIEERKEFWHSQEEDYFRNSNPQQKEKDRKRNIFYNKNAFNMHLPFVNFFLDEQVEAYRDIFGELSKLTKRMDYYKAEVGAEG